MSGAEKSPNLRALRKVPHVTVHLVLSQAGPEAEGVLDLRSRGWYSMRMGDPPNVELSSQSISVKEGHTVTASLHCLHLLSRMLRRWRFESAEMDRSKRSSEKEREK